MHPNTKVKNTGSTSAISTEVVPSRWNRLLRLVDGRFIGGNIQKVDVLVNQKQRCEINQEIQAGMIGFRNCSGSVAGGQFRRQT
jgi:hypothetical protein